MDSNSTTNHYQTTDDYGLSELAYTADEPSMFWVVVLAFNLTLFGLFVLICTYVVKV